MFYTKMQAQFWSFQSGSKKAFVITLDAFFAFFLISLVLSATFFYMSMEKNVLLESQTARTGSDLLVLAENKGVLKSFTAYNISSFMNITLPQNYGMMINLTWADSGLAHEYSLDVGNALPEKKFIATGKRFFVVIDYNTTTVTQYAMAKYWIWSK